MRLRTVTRSVLTGLVCLVLAGCITLSDPRVAPEAEPDLSTLTLQPDGPGAISIPGMGVNCTSVCTVPVEPGSMVGLMAVPSGSQGFAGWTGANCSGEDSCSINVEDDMTIKAVFANYFLDVDVEGGGTVHVSPPGIDCSSKCIVRFDEPVEVKVEKKVEKNEKTEIQDWGGLCENAVNSICVVNVDGKTEVEVETETEITNPPPAEDPPADDGTTDDGTTDDGTTDDGTTDDGTTDDGTTDDGTTDDGTTDDGTTDDGATDDGTTDDGTTDDGTTDDGTTDDGTTDNGTTNDGTADGATGATQYAGESGAFTQSGIDAGGKPNH